MDGGPGVGEVVGVHQVQAVAAHQLGFAPAEDVLRGGVGGGDHQVLARHQHDVRREVPQAVAVAGALGHLALQVVGELAQLALGGDPGGGLDYRVEHAQHPAVGVPQRAVAEGEIAHLRSPVAVQLHGEILDEGGLALVGPLGDGADAVPGFSPDVVEGPAEWRVLVAEDGHETVVVDGDALRPPYQAAGEVRGQDGVDADAQRLGPVLDRA